MRRSQHRGCSHLAAHLVVCGPLQLHCSLRRPAVWLLVLLVITAGHASEFPERECCDPVYPLPAPPASTTPYPSVPTATGHVGLDHKSSAVILDCLLARQICHQDQSCKSILLIINRLCGLEPVACSTVTVTKCQAALRTLLAYPYFKPTCLCREPKVDPHCNLFRTLLYDHPCMTVNKKEKDPYPVEALLTCNHANLVCSEEKKCTKLFDDFKTSCRFRDRECLMEERESCQAAWHKLKLSPLFGCFCPNHHMKKRCEKIFTLVNHNPCVDVLPASLDLSGTDSALYPYDPEQDKFRETWSPPTSLYPYFLMPPTTRPHLTHISHPYNVPPYETHTNNHLTVDDPILIPIVAIGGTSNVKLTSSRSGSISAAKNPSFDGIESQLENPLFGIRGANQKDINNLRQELQGYKDNINSSFFDEDGEARGGSSSHSSHVITKGQTSAEGDVEVKNFNFQSTCHLALDMCNNNHKCRSALQPLLKNCSGELSSCKRNHCMTAMQSFYNSTELKWSLEAAFCLCKKTDNKQDECLIAQEKLHPLCAQREEGTPLPTCHTLAQDCRKDPSCSPHLEQYEQACAVDSVTKKCASPPAECRNAMLKILGTSLRSDCSCKGVEISELYECYGWRRLLWDNRCVVQSQKDFHARRISNSPPQTTTPVRNYSIWTPAPPAPPPAPPSTMTTGTSPATWTTHVQVTAPRVVPTVPAYPVTTEAVVQTVPVIPVAPATTSTQAMTEEPTTLPTTPTTTLPTTTTEPPRYCIFQRAHQSDQLIEEGTGKRLYRENEPECSELCQCNEGEQLVCNTLCVDRAPCKTDFAFYNHAAPAYQAYRGRCMCYSGKFICMRPSPDMYDLPEGVFLFLGYSETDETLLKPHSNLTVHDTPEALQHLLRELSKKWECALYLYNVTKENVILVAKLANENYTFNREHIKHTSPDQLQHEKEECSGPLQDLSDKINNQHAKLHTHQLLSILKMAEVEIKVPASSSGSRLFWGSSWSTPLCLLWLLAVARPVLYAHTWALSPS